MKKFLVIILCLFSELLSARAWIPQRIQAWVKCIAVQKTKNANDSTKKLLAVQGLFGLGWLSKPEKPKEEVTPEVEKKVLEQIENASMRDVWSLHKYAETYASHAPIRNALMRKAIDEHYCGMEAKQLICTTDSLVKKLINHMDPTCEPQEIIKWIVKLELQTSKFNADKIDAIGFSKYKHGDRFKQMLEDIANEYFAFKNALKNKGLIKEAIRAAALQGKSFIFEGLTPEECKLLAKHISLEDLIYLGLYNSFDQNNRDKLIVIADRFSGVAHREHKIFWSNIPPQLLSFQKSKDAKVILSCHYGALSYLLKLDARDNRGFFSSPSPLNRFIEDCIKYKNIWWLGLFLLRCDDILWCGPDYQDTWRQGLKRYLTKNNFDFIVDFIAVHSMKNEGEKPSWQIYNNLRMHSEVRDIAWARLQKDGIRGLLECMERCKELIIDDARFNDYVVNKCMMGDGDFEFKKKLFQYVVKVFEQSIPRIEQYAKCITDFYLVHMSELRDVKVAQILVYARHLKLADKKNFVSKMRDYEDSGAVQLTASEFDLLGKL